MTERLNQILFAEFLNQCGCVTGVDTEKLLKEFNLEDIDLTTEKRFEDVGLLFLDGFIRDNLTNEVIDSETLTVKLLNDLSEENIHLKKENAYLNKKNDNLVNMIARVQCRADTIKEKNKQLKNEIEKLSYANEDLLEEKRIWKQMSDEYTKLSYENEQLKQENSVFEGKDAKHYQRWVNQIKKYVEETNTDFTYDDDFIIKIALSYTLQSLRNGESLKRFQWDYKELQE